jgi:Xaa-Pro aminopeptidase
MSTLETELLPYDRFSLAERDRRWEAVRSLMDEVGLSVIVTPANTGHSTDFQANSRYLSHVGGGSDADVTVIFPRNGEVTVGATSAYRWKPVQNWITDLREARRNYGNVDIERLKELDVDKARIGITGFGRGTRTPEGTILHHTARRIMREFPHATIVDATGILNKVRLVKSQEEIDVLARSVQVIEAGLQAELRSAKVGEVDHNVWAHTTSAMLLAGSEPHVHCHWASGPHPTGTLVRPSNRLLERGDVIVNELEASILGYRAQCVQPICVETCDPMYFEMFKPLDAVFQVLLEELKPGVTAAKLMAMCEEWGEKELPSSGPLAGGSVSITLHGRGQGDDAPILTPSQRNPHELNTELQENSVLIFKPTVAAADKNLTITWGDTVLITNAGGRRLGTRIGGMWVAK